MSKLLRFGLALQMFVMAFVMTMILSMHKDDWVAVAIFGIAIGFALIAAFCNLLLLFRKKQTA